MLKFLKFFKNCRRGFTLTELMAVVVILGILAAFAVPKVMNAVSSAKEKTDKANITAIENALERYYTDNGSYPTALSALEGKYLKTVPVDPYDNENYGYTLNNTTNPPTYSVTHSDHNTNT